MKWHVFYGRRCTRCCGRWCNGDALPRQSAGSTDRLEALQSTLLGSAVYSGTGTGKIHFAVWLATSCSIDWLKCSHVMFEWLMSSVQHIWMLHFLACIICLEYYCCQGAGVREWWWWWGSGDGLDNGWIPMDEFPWSVLWVFFSALALWTGRVWTKDGKLSCCSPYSRQKLRNNRGQAAHTSVPLSPSSITWYRPRGGDALQLGR